MNSQEQIATKDSIATRLLRVVFSFYLLIAFSVTLGHMVMEYRYQKDNISHDLEDIQRTFENGLAIDMWHLNEESLSSRLDGMLEIPVIVGVKIQDADDMDVALRGIIVHDGAVVNVGRHTRLLGITREVAMMANDQKYKFDVFMHRFPITYTYEQEKKQLGTATIYSDSSVVFRRVKLGFLLLVINAIVKTIALWVIFLFFSQSLLRKPLAVLTSASKKVSLKNLDSFKVDIKTHGRNELKVLEESFNLMIGNLHKSLDEQARAEEIARQGEIRMRTLMANIPGVSYRCACDAHWTMEFISDEVETLSGYRTSDFLKNRVRSFASIIHPDDRQTVERIVMLGVGENHPFTIEFRIIRADEELRWVYAKGQGIHGKDGQLVCIDGVIIDITQRKRAEEALKASEKRYRTLFERTTDAIFIVERKTGKYLDANEAAVRLTGRKISELTQMTTHDVTPGGARERLRRIGESSTAESLGEVTYKRPNGEYRVAMLNVITIDNEAVIGIARDITDEMTLQKQLKQAQKMEAIGTLAGGIAHDFNNILSAILGYSELLLADLPPKTSARNKVEAIHSSGKRARDLVAQILAFSRKDEQVRLPVEVDLVIQDALKLLRPAIPATIDIRTQISSNCCILGDPSRIHQIIMNLCTNAYQAMLETGGTLAIFLSPLKMEGEAAGHAQIPAGAYAKLIISDTGIGIPPDLLERIFDPYFTTKETGKGTGLGLAVVHGIVKSHGGNILVESLIGRGATFEVYLPLTQTDCGTEKKDAFHFARGNERILLVDDEQDILQIGKEVLNKLGYVITDKENARDALDVFTAQPDQFDLVITDMTMPNMTGDRLAEELRKIRPDIPIILCTGFSELISKEKAASLGIKGFLMKPISMRDFSNMIRRVLDLN